MSFAPTRARLIAAAIALPMLALTINPPSASAQPTAAPVPKVAPAAKAGAPASPGRFSGFGFDACTAPSQSQMNVLRRESPFWGVGIYLGGAERSCNQPNLDRSWVRTQRAKGWRLFPIWVDRQSACFVGGRSFETKISSNKTVAMRQGKASARAAVRTAKRFGLAKGSTLFIDIEDYNNTANGCNPPVFTYVSGWTTALRSLGYKGGLYAAGASGIRMLDSIRSSDRDAYVWPAQVWIAHGDGKATTRSSYLRSSLYRHQRAKQYDVDTTRTYGSVTLQLDLNAIDIGGGAVSPRKGPSCGVRLDFSRYHVLHRGMRSAQVKAAQCLLKQKGSYRGKVTGRFDRATAKAVGRYQQKFDLRTTREVGKATWISLHAAGSPKLLKRGSNSDRVRGLQRSLTAALGKSIRPSGIFGASTTSAVRSYQRKAGLPATGIVGTTTWKALKAGKR